MPLNGLFFNSEEAADSRPSKENLRIARLKIQSGWNQQERATRWLAGNGICDPKIQAALLPFLEFRTQPNSNGLSANQSYVV